MRLTGLRARLSGLLLGALLSAAPAAFATDLPSGVLDYLRHKDPAVKVRFDGLVLFSNGESYLPVIPQDPALNPDARQVVATIPEKAAYPDLIEFDNHFYLLRLIQTDSGRLTLPKLSSYPLWLKEGLLPQDFVLPANLYIPVELKVLLGALPYNPHYTPSEKPPLLSSASLLRLETPPDQVKSVARRAYMFNLDEQKIWAVDSVTGRKQGEISLDCVPASLRLSSDGKLLFAPCLSTNELVVVDTGANLVKTRIPVGNRPDSVVDVSARQEIWVSNRYSPFLSVIRADRLADAENVALPGNGGAMAIFEDGKTQQLLVADAFEPKIYRVDMASRQVVETWTALPEISAIRVLKDANGQPEIWVASRTKNQVMALKKDGAQLHLLNVAKKPVDLAVYNGNLLVLAAGDAQLQVIDVKNAAKQQEALTSISLGGQGFPSAIAAIPSEKRAYITMAGSNALLVVNLETGKVENTVPITFRAGMIAMSSDLLSAGSTPRASSTPPAISPKEPDAPPATLSETSHTPSSEEGKKVSPSQDAKSDGQAATPRKKSQGSRWKWPAFRKKKSG